MIKGQLNSKEMVGVVLTGVERDRVIEEHLVWLARAPEISQIDSADAPITKFLEQCGLHSCHAGFKGLRRIA